MKGKVLYAAIGIALCIATVVTGVPAFNEENQRIYELALSMQDEVDGIGIPGLRLSDHPVRYYDGKSDYVFTEVNGGIKEQKEKPILGAFVSTAYPVEGKYQIILLVIEKMNTMLPMMEYVSGAWEENGEIDGGGYGQAEHVATIWHEAMHAWQFTHFSKTIHESIGQKEASDTERTKTISDLDEDSTLSMLLGEGQSWLLKAVQEKSIADKLKDVLQYKQIEMKRERSMTKESIAMENYYLTIEGMACYVESEVYKLLKGDLEYQAEYIDTIDDHGDGTAKYYRMGMAMCLLLDDLMPDWKSAYDYSTPLSNLLDEVLESMMKR